MEVITAAGINAPNMPMLVNVAKTPPAGVNPAYMNDWNAAATDPALCQNSFSVSSNEGCVKRHTSSDTGGSEAQTECDYADEAEGDDPCDKDCRDV